MNTSLIHQGLYLANATVLLTHQIDAAYWHEWDLFGLPGGIQLFLVLNIPIIGVVLYGMQRLAVGARSGTMFSWLLIACGLFAVVFHAFHLFRGDEAFVLPVSLALLVGTAVLSVAQAAVLVSLQRKA